MSFVRSSLLKAAAVSALAAAPFAAATYTPAFQHIATFDVIDGNGSAVAEIIDASPDGRELIYTDADTESIGFVDIRSPYRPRGTGTVPVGGEPTSLAILGNWVLVAVNTSPSVDEPSGQLLVIDRKNRKTLATLELGGQPDSIAISPSEKWAAIVIENEREDDELLPNNATGTLLILSLRGAPAHWELREADLSPVAAAAFAGGDLEPEYVDINGRDQAVVTFQENNHLAVVDLKSGKTISQFSAGSAELSNVDTEEEDLIKLNSDITKRREPDAVTWIDNRTFATANEGDYEDENGEEGGSRGFTIFKKNGKVLFESAESFEHVLVSAGHYNEGRSENKGVEPEAVEYARYFFWKYLFVGSERSNAVGVYDVNRGTPRLVQVLPTGIGPEGIKAVPRRGLLIVSTESDEADAGIPTMVNIYRLGFRKPSYPMIASADDENGLPIPWVALSAMVGDPNDEDLVYATSDSFLAEGFIYTVDVSERPAKIVDRLQVTGVTATPQLDLEGIAVGPDGDFWLASEGRSDGARVNVIAKVDATTGAVQAEYTLPAGLAVTRNNGFEGLAVSGEAGSEIVHAVIQRAWPGTGDTDEVNTKIARLATATGTWDFVHYPLEPEGEGDWIGLSEITLLPDGSFAIIERDKGWGPTTGFNAELKAIFRVELDDAEFRAFDDPRGLVTIDKALLVDVTRALARRSIWTAEKLEGLAVAADGTVYVVTDNDGVDDAPGETVFFSLGNIERLLDEVDDH